MAAIEVMLDNSFEFALWWAEIGIDERLRIMDDMQIAIETAGA